MTRPAKIAWLAGAALLCAVVAGLWFGPNAISNVTYSQFRPVWRVPSHESGTGILNRPISTTYRDMIELVLIERGIPYEMRDGVLFVRNREWWNERLMAEITLASDHPAWPEITKFRDDVKLLPLHPERTVLAETALFREHPTEHAIEWIECMLRYYGIYSARWHGHLLMPELILRSAGFLRFAAAKAGDRKWIDEKRPHRWGCGIDDWKPVFTSYGAPAPGQPWPHYSADELAQIVREYGIETASYIGEPEQYLRVSSGLYDEPEILELIVSPAPPDSERLWPGDVADGPFPLLETLDLGEMTPAEIALFQGPLGAKTFANLPCALRYYGVLVSHHNNRIKAPRHVLRNDAFLRFAAAKASDADWLDRVRARHRLCWSGLETVTFAADGVPAADSPWPSYDKGDLTDALSYTGIAHRRLADAALRVPASLYREPEVLALLVSGTAASSGAGDVD